MVKLKSKSHTHILAPFRKSYHFSTNKNENDVHRKVRKEYYHFIYFAEVKRRRKDEKEKRKRTNAEQKKNKKKTYK